MRLVKSSSLAGKFLTQCFREWNTDLGLRYSVVKGVYAIRVVSANPKTDEKHLRKAFDIFVRTTLDTLDKMRRESEEAYIKGKPHL